MAEVLIETRVMPTRQTIDAKNAPVGIESTREWRQWEIKR